MATLGIPSRIGSMVRMPSWIGPVIRKLRVTTLIRCRRGSLSLITHLGTWKLDEIGVYPRIKWATHNWPSLCTKTLALSILSRLSLLTRLKFGSVACLFEDHQENKKAIWNRSDTNQGEMGNFKVIFPVLKPHLVTPLSLGRGGHRSTPLTRSKNPYSKKSR